MAPLFDAAQQGGYNGVVVATRTWNHTVLAGSGMILWVSGCCFGGNVASATYGGVVMAELSDLASGTCLTNWFYLINPPTGLNAVVITFSAALGNVAWTSASYSGVDPVNPLGTLVEATNVADNISVNVTSEADELVIDCVGRRGVGDVCTQGAGQTERAEGTSGAGRATATSEEAGAALVAMSWTFTGGADNNTIAAVPMKPWLDYLLRPVEYTLDAWDPEQRILDSLGHIVPRYKIKPNNWIRIVGLGFTTAEVYERNYDDPSLAYIESVKYDGETDQVQIVTNRGDLPEVIMARLASGSTG